MLKCLPFIKGCGTHIEYIEKSHASLPSVPDDVLRSYRTLEECKLDANQIKELPNSFFRLEKLRVLSVSDNELTRIPPSISNFSMLVELDISRNDISELPPSLRFCESLQIFDASNNSLKTLPEGFSQLRSLRVLNLNDVSLFELPNDFGGLKKLQRLELRDNCLNRLPNTFGELINLEFLDLGGNDFVTLPPSIGELHSLVDLWLDDNQLTSLPDEVGNLRALQQMDVSENHLSSIPTAIGGLDSLSDLNLTQNYLDSLPDEIGQLRSLTVLKMNRNLLVDLTPAIGKCVNLLEFYLTENFLSTLPSTIGNLTKMFHFNATKNQLVDLPNEIGNCTSLQILSLRDNNLRRMPSEIGNCTELHVLDLAGNRLERLPVSLTSCPLKALWLIQSQAQPISLQRVRDDLTGEEYLTCYLLPQESDDRDASRNGAPTSLSSASATSNQFRKELESVNGTLIPPQIQSPASSSVANIEEVEKGVSEDKVDVDDGDTTQAGGPSCVHFTPESTAKADCDAAREYPKTRHPMHLKKSSEVDKGDHRPLLPRAAADLQPNTNDQNNAIGEPVHFSALHRHSDAQGGVSLPIYLHKSEEPKGPLHSAISDSPRFPIRGTNAHASNHLEVVSDVVESSSLISPGSSASSGGIDDLLSVNTGSTTHRDLTSSIDAGPIRTRRPGGGGGGSGGVAFAQVAEVKRVDQEKREDNDGGGVDADEQGYSSGGEEIGTITNSVAFSDEVIDNEGNSSQKLIRRDTPHYTKRARIHRKNSDDHSEETVLKLLKKYHDPSVADSFADNSAPENTKTANALLMVAAAAAANSGASPVDLQNFTDSSVTPKTEQVTVYVTLERAPGGGLGLSIAGGVGSVPFRGLDQGVFVSRLAPGGLAETSGLKVGDKLLEVNGVSMINVEHQVAVSALRADVTRFKLLLCREVPLTTHGSPGGGQLCSSTMPTPSASHSLAGSYLNEPQKARNLPSSLLSTTSLGRNIPNGNALNVQAPPTAMQLIKCTLHRDWSGMGFSIAGGRGLLGPQLDAATIYISRIVEGGAADKSGRLRVGDQLFKINGIDTRNARHDQVITLLTSAGTDVELEVLRKLPSPSDTVTSPPLMSPNLPVAADGIAQPPPSPPLLDGPVLVRNEEGLEVFHITLMYTHGRSIGFAICGGADTSALPFGSDTPGVFVCRVHEDGEAKQAGLRLGDRLLSVNGRDLRDATHDDAVAALVPPTLVEGPLVLEIRRDPLPTGLREIVIPCSPDETLGLNLVSMRSPATPPPPASCSKPAEEGIFVCQISPKGAVAHDGRLKLGDRLLLANSEWLMSLDTEDLSQTIKPLDGSLRLTVCEGIDPSSFAGITPAARDSYTASQLPSHANLCCHLIDCDAEREEHLQPLKISPYPQQL